MALSLRKRRPAPCDPGGEDARAIGHRLGPQLPGAIADRDVIVHGGMKLVVHCVVLDCSTIADGS